MERIATGNASGVGISIGIAIAPDNGAGLDVLMRRADLALYQAKQQGRNRLRFFEPAFESAVEPLPASADRRQNRGRQSRIV